jgi:hypothetical protein
MTLTIAAVAAFGILGANWATPAQADGGSGTVPGGGGGSGGGGSNNNTNPTNNPQGFDPDLTAATCGAGTQTFSLLAPNDVTGLLKLGIGTVKLNSNTGGVGNGAVRILFAPITSFTARLIAATALNPSPEGWTDLGCGIQTSGKVSDGRALTYVVKGQQVCFTLPVGAAAAYSTLRIAYWDTALTRWVFLNTRVTDTQACHSSFRLAPATFALFGSA